MREFLNFFGFWRGGERGGGGREEGRGDFCVVLFCFGFDLF